MMYESVKDTHSSQIFVVWQPSDTYPTSRPEDDTNEGGGAGEGKGERRERRDDGGKGWENAGA